MNSMDYATLSNGAKMPMIGYGVYQVDPAECERCTAEALAVGYRSIDTAQAYQNEEGVGNAVKKCGVPRDDLFLTSKMWIYRNEDEAEKALTRTVARLGTVPDLMLLHQPYGDVMGTVRVLRRAVRDGRVRAWGLSNFAPFQVENVIQTADEAPAVDQIETHPYLQQAEAHTYLEAQHVQHESWAPFAEGRNGLFQDPVLRQIGAAHGKSPAQVVLRFLTQSDIVVIPKSTHRERMAENLDSLDFKLSQAELAEMRQMDRKVPLFVNATDPVFVRNMCGYRPA